MVPLSTTCARALARILSALNLRKLGLAGAGVTAVTVASVIVAITTSAAPATARTATQMAARHAAAVAYPAAVTAAVTAAPSDSDPRVHVVTGPTLAQLAADHELHLRHLAHLSGLRAARAQAAAAAVTTNTYRAVPAKSQAASAGNSWVPSGTLGCAGLEQLWRAAGGSPGAAFMAAEIAMAESGGNQYAVSPTQDYGYWQINLAAHGSMATFSPVANAQAAIVISADGTNWGPWTTFQIGAYQGKC